jgi:5-methylcytosine-specific restriction endonuclease McrA
MKTCAKCEETKDLSEFGWNASKGKHQAYCRECFRAYAKAYASSPDGRAKRHARLEARRAQNRLKIAELKKAPCVDCGGTFHPDAMEFDHLPEHTKYKGIAVMLQEGQSWAALAREIAKCELVCANCHRIRTRHRLFMLRT